MNENDYERFLEQKDKWEHRQRIAIKEGLTVPTSKQKAKVWQPEISNAHIDPNSILGRKLKDRDLTMAYEMRELNGSLFKNETATGNQPTYKGNCLIDGKKYYISAWVKESAGGKKYLSLAYQAVESVEAAKSAPAPAVDQDIPF
jgi:cytochrome b involved in lipid metabolism